MEIIMKESILTDIEMDLEFINLKKNTISNLF